MSIYSWSRCQGQNHIFSETLLEIAYNLIICVRFRFWFSFIAYLFTWKRSLVVIFLNSHSCSGEKGSQAYIHIFSFIIELFFMNGWTELEIGTFLVLLWAQIQQEYWVLEKIKDGKAQEITRTNGFPLGTWINPSYQLSTKLKRKGRSGHLSTFIAALTTIART